MSSKPARVTPLTATDPAAPDLVALLKACRSSALHLEMRDVYAIDGENEEFSAWKAGHRDDPADPESWWRPWLTLIQEATKRGVEVRRARIVSEPVSEYIHFEYDGTHTNVYAGERIRWLPRRRASDLRLPGNDFWVFDDEVVVWLYFSGDGVPDRPRGWSTDPEVITYCREAFEAVWERGIDHAKYTI